MTQLHDLRLRLLVQQESEQIANSQPTELDLSVVQARCLCWLALLAESHEEQASDAERRGDTEQAMGWFAEFEKPESDVRNWKLTERQNEVLEIYDKLHKSNLHKMTPIPIFQNCGKFK